MKIFLLLCSLMVLLAGSPRAVAADGPPGLVAPVVFAPFKPDAPACSAPPDLQRTLVFARDNSRQFMEGVHHGLALATKDRGLGYDVMLANNDAAKMVEHVKSLYKNHVGAVVVSPVDPAALSRSLQDLIWAGSYVGAVVPPPAISILNAPQYLTGKKLGDAAAAYIRDKLHGKANVVLLTHDKLQFLAPRFTAMRDSLKSVPGATVIADISPVTVDKQGGFAMMNTILLAQPEVDVVLGADTVVLGALEALRAAGKARDTQFLGGIDGEAEAVAEIKKQGPYKTTISLASPIFGYAMGQHAADWLEGRSVPQAMDILPTVLDAANISNYEADTADPAKVYHNLERRNAYLKMYGNICYDTRDQYVNFPWSSEAKP